ELVAGDVGLVERKIETRQQRSTCSAHRGVGVLHLATRLHGGECVLLAEIDRFAERNSAGAQGITSRLRTERGGNDEKRDERASGRGKHHLWQEDLIRLRSASRRTSSSLRRASRR